jgi:long-chain fatty acid transport protein
MKRILLPLIALMPLLSTAGGFQVNLQGTKQTGMGHLGTSFYLGASSVYFNPAMMGMGDTKINIEAGASFISSTVAYQDQNTGLTEETDNSVGTPFYLYGTYQINDKFTAGLGIYTPFGSSIEWGEDWSGNQLIQDISLRAIFIQPTISYMVNEKLRIGGGVNIVLGSVDLNRNIGGSVGNDNVVNLEGDATGFGFTFGAHYQVNEKLSAGLTYKSQVDIELEGGTADFTVHPVVGANGVADTEFDATLPLPAMTTLGIAYQANDKFLISIEASMIDWDAYESLDFDFKDNTENLQDSDNPRNYEDSYILRIGAQYAHNDMLTFRTGIYLDQSPVQDQFFSPETPNTDNIGMTLGLSANLMENFTIDASVLYIIGMERDSYYTNDNGTFGGKYAARSFIPGIGLNYKF